MSYDILMLLVLTAAGLWGYWKGFVWQLASLASIFSSYTLAFVLRVQVAKLIDLDPPLNTFAAMGVVYLLSSLVIWLATAAVSSTLESFKLKDFDRQLGATFGVAKGAIFCLLITFFAVSLLGQREQQRICSSTSGRFMARVLRNSGGMIPQELHAVIDPYLNPFQQKLDSYQPADAWAQQQQQPAQPGTAWQDQNAGATWNQAYAEPQYPPPTYQPPYDPRYDPRYAPPAPAYDPRYAPPPTYQDPRYDSRYAPPYDPRYDRPPAYQPPPESYPNSPPYYPAQPPASYAPDPRTSWR
jgi:membrane protein required for colicin V production